MRELDYHDTFLAADYSHPGDNIPPIVAVAQHTGPRRRRRWCGRSPPGYEIQVDLVRAISLHAHKIDHVAHLGPSVAAGLGTLLGLSPEVIFQAVGQALHTTTATRQSRKGEISTWKAYAPAFAGKVAIEAVDRAMRGETSPTPIYEGEDGVIAWMLDGPGRRATTSPLPGPGRAQDGDPRHVHQGALGRVPVAGAHRPGPPPAPRAPGPHATRTNVASIVIHTLHHTHYVIGSGANDPQKYDPTASRETLDHSIPYIVAVALQDGAWHHVDSYAPERAGRPDTVALWQKITTTEDPEWTRRYHATDPAEKAFGGRVEYHDRRPARSSRPRSPWPTRTRSAPGRSRASSTWPSSARWPRGCWTHAEIERFLDVAQRLPVPDAPTSSPASRSSPRPACSSRSAPRRDSSDAATPTTTPADKRVALRERLASGRLLRFPARSTRCPRGSSRTRASTASTSPARCCRPTWGCPTSG